LICDEATKFISFFQGYKKYCSKKCAYSSDYRVDKIKSTKLEKYGDANYNNTRKNRDTCLSKYGVSNGGATEASILSAKETRIKKYGSYSWNNAEKNKDTSLEKYGVSHYTKTEEYKSVQRRKLKSKDYQRKLKQGMISKYGVEYANQIGEFFEKSKYKYHEYILPSGKVIRLQGYEPKTMTDLLKIYNEGEILYKASDMPEIWYEFAGKVCRYYPDFYIPIANLLVETKSEYTAGLDVEKNTAKFEAVKNAGYEFEIKIY
jgi:hypothetical protein